MGLFGEPGWFGGAMGGPHAVETFGEAAILFEGVRLGGNLPVQHGAGHGEQRQHGVGGGFGVV